MNSTIDILSSLGIKRPGADPVVLVIAAHPDDEVIGAGGVLRYLKKAHFYHVTDGSPRKGMDAMNAGCTSREAYARVRCEELLQALKHAGFGPEDCSRIGMIDQEVSFNMAGLAWRIADIIEEWRPDVVFTHPFEGGHPDHDATAFAVSKACVLAKKKTGSVPKIIEFASYHGNGGIELVAGEFLPFPKSKTWKVVLNDIECDLKQGMMDCFKSQRQTLEAFSAKEENYRIAPEYDFSKAPHKGVLYYEFFDWGISGRKWIELAEEASGLLEK